jgi:MOSC domain-containing protein YiiM
MGDDTFPSRFDDAGRPGVYLRIVKPGAVTAGDAIGVVPAAEPAVDIATLVGADSSEIVMRQIVADDRVPRLWRRAAQRMLDTS